MNEQTAKTALITGASSGIGQELAKLFAQDGYNLVLVARSDDKLDRLADVFRSNYGTERITVIGKDLATEDAAQDVYDQVKAQKITIDVLVNDAGVGLYGKFATDTDWEREKAMIHLNVLTLTQMTKLFLYDMLARNEGKILNLASLLSITPTPLMAVFAGTKAYVYNFTQSIANELKDTNVSITALLPNATDTDFYHKAGADNAKLTDDVQDPVVVAKAGYDSLMAGKVRAVPGGLKNKSYEVLSYVASPETLAATMRSKMAQKPDPNEKNTTLAWSVGFGLAVAAGFALVWAYKTANPVDQARYRLKARSLGNSVVDSLASVAEEVAGTLIDSYKTAKASAVEATDETEEELEEATA